MLTRIEVDGFKNLLGFSAEFGPFTCIAGPNAVGKSNLFDAIEFLSLLAQHPLDKAASLVRATPGAHEPARALFWNDGEVWAERIRIAVELLVDGWVADDLGRGVLPDSPRYRYELELRFDAGLRLAGERLLRIGAPIRFPHHPGFAQAHRLNVGSDDTVIFDLAAGVMPDGGAAPDLRNATRTVLQLYQTVEHPGLLAVAQELHSWRRFALNPVDLRKPHEIGSATRLSESGEHLPLLFMRSIQPGYPDIVIRGDHQAQSTASLSAQVIARLGRLAGLREIHVEEDQDRNLLTIRATARGGEKLSARMLSEGSLRALALVLLGLSPGDAVICVEEPENGIHPGQFDDLVRILYELSTDATVDVTSELQDERPDATLPLRQAIITTHSSELVERIFAAHKDDLLMATSISVEGPQQRPATVLAAQPLRDTWRCHAGVRGVMLPMLAYVDYAKLATHATASAAEDS